MTWNCASVAADHEGRRLVSMKSISANLKGATILVLEDHQDTAELLQMCLTQEGAKVICAHTAAEAISAIRQNKPNVVISDLTLPDVDGFSFIKALRQMPVEEGGQVPVIALTGATGDDFRLRVLVAGFQGYVSKPFDPTELVVIVSGWIKK